MSQAFARSVLKVAVAQICQNIGWNSIHTTPLELLVDILHKYLNELAKTTHRYGEQFGRTDPNLDDLGLAFRDIGIPLGELEEYVNNVEPVPFVHNIPKFPLPRTNSLLFLPPGAKELQHRPEWIDDHLPAMYPEDEAEQKMRPLSPLMIPDSRRDQSGGEGSSPMASPHTGIKRPLDLTPDSGVSTPKRTKLISEGEGRSMREVTTVAMTPAGIVALTREGRLPDSRLPVRSHDDSRPGSPLGSVQVGKKDKNKSKKDKSKSDKKKDGKKQKKGKENEKKIKSKNKSKNKIKNNPKKSTDNKMDLLIAALEQGTDNPEFTFKESDEKKKKSGSKSPSKKSSKSKDKKNSPKVIKSGDDSIKKSPSKVKKPPKPKTPKPEKLVPGGQLASLMAKMIANTNKDKEVNKSSPSAAVASTSVKTEVDRERILPKLELGEPLSREDSPERLVIDDNPELIERQDRENRLAVLDECINAVIKRGIKEADEAPHHSRDDQYRINDTINDVVRHSADKDKLKLEPKDVYDFTDEEPSPPATPGPPRTPEPLILPTPPSKKEKRSKDKIESTSSKKDKNKNKKSKNKSKSPRSPRGEPLDLTRREDSSETSDEEVPQQFGTPSLSSIPAALLPSQPGSGMGMYLSGVGGPGRIMPPSHIQALYPHPPGSQVDGTAKSEEKERKKEHSKDKDESGKSKLKEGKKDKKEKEKDKSKTKKKKDKSGQKRKEKESKDKSSKEKSKDKSKKDKSDKKNKDKTKKDKKDKDKAKDEKEKIDAALDASSSIPKLTLKLGPTAPEVPKLVIKPYSRSDAMSPSPPPPRDPTPVPARVPTPSPARVPTPAPPTALPRDAPNSPPSSSPSTPTGKSKPSSKGKAGGSGTSKRGATPASAPTCTVVTETVGTIIDESGNKIWICPACKRPDDGSPMIGCDSCDDWYHWVCVGIVIPPKDEEEWFCNRCVLKKQPTQKKKRKKHRKE